MKRLHEVMLCIAWYTWCQNTDRSFLKHGSQCILMTNLIHVLSAINSVDMENHKGMVLNNHHTFGFHIFLLKASFGFKLVIYINLVRRPSWFDYSPGNNFCVYTSKYGTANCGHVQGGDMGVNDVFSLFCIHLPHKCQNPDITKQKRHVYFLFW